MPPAVVFLVDLVGGPVEGVLSVPTRHGRHADASTEVAHRAMLLRMAGWRLARPAREGKEAERELVFEATDGRRVVLRLRAEE